jgi:hypothetical protein
MIPVHVILHVQAQLNGRNRMRSVINSIVKHNIVNPAVQRPLPHSLQLTQLQMKQDVPNAIGNFQLVSVHLIWS